MVTYLCSCMHNLPCPHSHLAAMLLFFFGLKGAQKERLVFLCVQDVRATKVSAELSQLHWLHRPLSFLKWRTSNTSRDTCSGTSISSCLLAAEVCRGMPVQEKHACRKNTLTCDGSYLLSGCGGSSCLHANARTRCALAGLCTEPGVCTLRDGLGLCRA